MGIFKNIFIKEEDSKQTQEIQQPAQVKKESSEDLSAIIATTIHLYLQEAHDFQNYSLTIKRIDKIYSPWSSKIYGLRKWPRQKF
jgi:glutaconyl-CoA/methylmalonyl-CoA decarboxylase subunit delta